jgi:hypothetical protein
MDLVLSRYPSAQRMCTFHPRLRATPRFPSGRPSPVRCGRGYGRARASANAAAIVRNILDMPLPAMSPPRSSRCSLTPLRSQAASAVCARDPEIEVGPRPQDQTAVVSVLVYKLYSLGESTKRVPYRLPRYNRLISKYPWPSWRIRYNNPSRRRTSRGSF